MQAISYRRACLPPKPLFLPTVCQAVVTSAPLDPDRRPAAGGVRAGVAAPCGLPRWWARSPGLHMEKSTQVMQCARQVDAILGGVAASSQVQVKRPSAGLGELRHMVGVIGRAAAVAALERAKVPAQTDTPPPAHTRPWLDVVVNGEHASPDNVHEEGGRHLMRGGVLSRRKHLKNTCPQLDVVADDDLDGLKTAGNGGQCLLLLTPKGSSLARDGDISFPHSLL
ncbi:hypothetical protein B0H14DRAFT_3906684, partial [Mycena olivaceomarginata]